MIAEVLVICYSFIVMKKSFLILVLAVAVAAFNPAQTAAQTGTQSAAQTGAQTAAQTGAQTAALSIRDVPAGLLRLHFQQAGTRRLIAKF